MDASRLKQLLVLDEYLTEKARQVGYNSLIKQWVFRPAGAHRDRIFFVWIDEDREIGGTRCRDDPEDPVEPWRWHVYLPKLFLRTMLDMVPEEEVAAAIAKCITR